jgi:SulP family sulfate permease
VTFPPALLRLLPFLNWPRPTLTSLRSDAWAGISVGLVLIPQAIAYATLAGMPPQTGLYAALLPTVVGILWGSSPLLAVGPVALTSLLVFGSLSAHAAPGSGAWIVLAIWLSLYSGVIQLLLGVFKLGKISYLVSMPVMAGFINAAAVIIIASQLSALAGVEVRGSMAGVLSGETPIAWSQIATAYGAISLVLLLAFKRYLPRWPGILLVTILGIWLSASFDYAGHGGAVIGSVPRGLPPIAWPPSIPYAAHLALLPAAVILALISFTEAMSSCKSLARKQKQDWDENQELIGQGLAKITSAACGAFPVSGSFSRSALNLYAGATSAWATLFSVVCVSLSLLFLTDYLYYLPRSVLAAMIIVPVFALLDVRGLRRLFSISRDDGWIAVITFAVTLLSTPHLYWGIATGVSLTMIAFLYRRTHPRIIEVARHEDGTLRDRARLAIPPIAHDLLAVRMDSALNFLTAAQLERFVTQRLRETQSVGRVLLCAGSINDLDATGAESLEGLRQSLQAEGIDLFVSAPKKQVWDVLTKSGFIAALGPENFFTTDSDAIESLIAATDSENNRAGKQIARQAMIFR